MSWNTDERRERAERLAEAAKHDSVTVDRLLGDEGYDASAFLYDDPAIDYLDDDEQPHFCFFNEMKGIEVGSGGETITPDGAGATLVFLTDKRMLLLVGQQDGDVERSIPHTAVTGATYHTGIMKHRIAIETTETTVHCWIDTGFGEEDLRQLVNVLEGAAERNRNRSTPTPGTDESAGSRSGAETRPQTTDGSGNATDTSSAASTGSTDGSSTGGTSDGEPDAIDKLERLKELHENGVVTDEEFEAKKRELLDQI